jgi:hypothetical protein
MAPHDLSRIPRSSGQVPGVVCVFHGGGTVPSSLAAVGACVPPYHPRLRGLHESGQNGGMTSVWVFVVVLFVLVIGLFVFMTRR